jgi:hypothetical protein
MRHDVSERDRLLERRWRALLQERQALYNVDYSHQCLLERPSAIGRPFVCAPHFYGCGHCGQHHRCYLNPRECTALVEGDSSSMSCQYSGQLLPVLAPPTWVGNHRDQLIFEDCPTTCEEYLSAVPKMKMTRSAVPRSHERTVYSNSRIKVPRAARDKVEHHRERKHPVTVGEESLMQSFLSTVPCRPASEEALEVDVEVVVEEEEEEMEVEDKKQRYERVEEDYDACDIGRETGRVENESNEVYWDDYYSFLDYSGLYPVLPPQLPQKHLEMEIVEVAQPITLTEAIVEEVHQRTMLLVEHLFALNLLERKDHRLEKTGRRPLQTRLVQYFEPRIQRIVLLVYQTPEMQAQAEERRISASHICEALLLNLFLHSFSDEDQYGYRLEIWHMCHWLKEMAQNGVMDILFGEAPLHTLGEEKKKEENGRRWKKKRRRLKSSASLVGDLSRGRVKQSSETVKHALDHYKGNGLWLRHFIQGPEKS